MGGVGSLEHGWKGSCLQLAKGPERRVTPPAGMVDTGQACLHPPHCCPDRQHESTKSLFPAEDKSLRVLSAQCTKAATTSGPELAQEISALIVKWQTIVCPLGHPWQTGRDHPG